MKGTLWRAFLGSFVLFLLSCAACDHGTRQVCITDDMQPWAGYEDCGWYLFPSEWEGLGALMFIASLSVAAGGAMRWWREQVDVGADVGAKVLNLDGAADAVAVAEIKDAGREEVPALPAASLPAEQAHPFEHFDERGLSPLERVLAEY